jgi:hypothetical protein
MRLGVICWFYAMTRIPIAEVTAMNYLNPIYVTVLAVFVLGERISARRALAILFALAGAMVILRPGFRELDPGHIAMLFTAGFFAVGYLVTKILADEVPAAVVVFMLSVVVPIVLAPIAFAVWVPVGLGGSGLAVRHGGLRDGGALHHDAGVSGRAPDGDAAGDVPSAGLGHVIGRAGLCRAGGCLRDPGRDDDHCRGQLYRVARGGVAAARGRGGVDTGLRGARGPAGVTCVLRPEIGQRSGQSLSPRPTGHAAPQKRRSDHL